MTRAKRDGLSILLAGALIFCLLAAYLSKSPLEPLDFKVVYYPTQCVIRGLDPYNQKNVRSLYPRAQGSVSGSEKPVDEEIRTRSIYPPTTFAAILPFGWMPWPVASALWLVLTASSLVLAAFLI